MSSASLITERAILPNSTFVTSIDLGRKKFKVEIAAFVNFSNAPITTLIASTTLSRNDWLVCHPRINASARIDRPTISKPIPVAASTPRIATPRPRSAPDSSNELPAAKSCAVFMPRNAPPAPIALVATATSDPHRARNVANADTAAAARNCARPVLAIKKAIPSPIRTRAPTSDVANQLMRGVNASIRMTARSAIRGISVVPTAIAAARNT